MSIRIPEPLTRFASTPKRFKVMIGGRGSGKSETTASLFAAMVQQSGCRAVCCREFQTSIKQSVHNLVRRKIGELGLEGFNCKESQIDHANGGQIIYQGLSRDPEAIKSIDNAELCWVEEAQSLSQDSLEKLTPSIRGEASEIWMTANLGSSTDPFSARFIKPFEKQLRATGWYEDDLHLICWINYDQNPWFPDELQRERVHDLEYLSEAAYAHKWLGEFNDSVENALIRPEWFDACVDAHKRLGFQPRGIEVVAHDPSDTGSDNKGIAYRHGVVIKDVLEQTYGDVNEGGDWASDYALSVRPDLFVWDGDGMGVGLRRQFKQAFDGKRIDMLMFQGSNAPENPDQIYDQGDDRQQKTNSQTFRNRRAQYYWNLRERCRKTWDACVRGDYIDPDELISFSSEIEGLDLLRAEICSVPTKPNGQGMIQIMSKPEMQKAGIPSPNMADAIMMAFAQRPRKAAPKLDYSRLNKRRAPSRAARAMR